MRINKSPDRSGKRAQMATELIRLLQKNPNLRILIVAAEGDKPFWKYTLGEVPGAGKNVDIVTAYELANRRGVKL